MDKKTDQVLNTYWESRATEGVIYKGERFYTITSLPLYWHRRNILLREIEKIINKELKSRERIAILDFGCGDGYYSMWLKQSFGLSIDVNGIDLSNNMIKEAVTESRKRGLTIDFQTADGRIPYDRKFNVIILVAVLAHVMDEDILNTIAEDISKHLANNGKIIVFESTANTGRKGTTWFRRTEREYEELFKKYSLSLEEKLLVAFPFFTKLDRYLKKSVSLLSKLKIIKKYNNINHCRYYLFASSIFLKISLMLDKWLNPTEGNTLFVFKKSR